MKKLYVRSIVAGLLLALLVIRMFHTFSSPFSYQLFVLFLAYTACVYLGAALADSRIKWISVEFAMSCLFFTFAFLGYVYSPIWVGVGFILHGIWDMFHHPHMIKTKVIKWFPPLCATYDFIVAIFILTFY
ncbi:DUF6010 family protein [Bacillus sp. CGMCC 1.16607]|uniref:DUF6010 family protein n=1 Tax=Bacillus sp. CGMCC 1.16607 TaxID=3351842 RepID=UPI003628ACA2